ncbi:hypothetical protein LEP1GSC199_3505 [Leptospira vanthielii serovar Holland str. Waz Holland = ATCC 700522]|uniref:Uncharacterized protein n=1 Tax=Leptospira vanthielii serovar Holland str. Waz Holland = ATCC 700522 TaxID=1218591 RepID=N1W4R8_9LEPT|nr:hypothetical protein LEP1GSC199_3505 [Leptospira vanthielii serovar Holland str. Waz Holland = ATCC 700522]
MVLSIPTESGIPNFRGERQKKIGPTFWDYLPHLAHFSFSY